MAIQKYPEMNDGFREVQLTSIYVLSESLHLIFLNKNLAVSAVWVGAHPPRFGVWKRLQLSPCFATLPTSC